MPKSLLIAGSLAYDRIMDYDGYFRDNFIPEGLHNINVSFMVNAPKVEFGGCSANIAYTLKLLGESADIADCVGNDFAPFATYLETLGIPTNAVQIYDDTPTASAYIMTDKDENQITAFSEGAHAKPYTKEINFGSYRSVFISTVAIKNALTIATACKAVNVPYSFDPGQKLTMYTGEELKTIATGADMLFMNDYESKLFCEKTGWTEADIVANVNVLVITLGKDGSRIITKNGEEKVPAVTVEKVIDPTGAGDAYRAGFLKGLALGFPHALCAKMGSVAGAYAVECHGTQNHTFTKDAFIARYTATYNESLSLA